MIPEPLEALGRVFDQLEIKHDFEDERLLTGFGGTNAPYSISIVAWQSAEEWWNFDLRAYIRTGGRHTGSFPLMAVSPHQFDEAHRFLNYLNGRWLTAGHAYIDPDDGDISFRWTGPFPAVITEAFADHLLGAVSQIDHFFPELRAIMADGMTAMGAIASHNARDAADRESRQDPSDDDAQGNDDDEPETFPFPE